MWGSATGALFSWEPFDFGLRRANVTVAENLVTQAEAGAELTRLQVAARAADAFLAAVEADELVRAAQANVDRLSVFATSVATLVQINCGPARMPPGLMPSSRRVVLNSCAFSSRRRRRVRPWRSSSVWPGRISCPTPARCCRRLLSCHSAPETLETLESAGAARAGHPELFFSHRRDKGRTGRQAGLVVEGD